MKHPLQTHLCRSVGTPPRFHQLVWPLTGHIDFCEWRTCRREVPYGGSQEPVSKVFCVYSCRPPCDEIPVFTGMTRLEYGAISLNAVEYRNPDNRDRRGPRILKQAPETRRYDAVRAISLNGRSCVHTAVSCVHTAVMRAFGTTWGVRL